MAFVGTDASLEISLREYGVVAKPYKEDYEDEWFVIYRHNSYGKERYSTGFTREQELNSLIMGYEWADEKDVKSFLNTNDISREDWLKLPFIHKIQSCISYWGTINIMGEDYSEGISFREAAAIMAAA